MKGGAIVIHIDLTLIFSLIGCVTGCAGLAINFYRFLSEQFKLKVYFGEQDALFFNKLDSLKSYKTNLQGFIRINFVNKSSSPVTIYDIQASINGKPINTRQCELTEINLISEVWSEHRYQTLVFPMDKQIIFPLRIEAYNSYEGYLFIPFFPDTDNETEVLNLTIKTTKKIIKKTCVVKKFNTTIHDDTNNDYI